MSITYILVAVDVYIPIITVSGWVTHYSAMVHWLLIMAEKSESRDRAKDSYSKDN